jgi:transposase
MREVFNGLRWIVRIVHDLRVVLRLAAGHTAEPSAAIFDSRTVQSTPESGPRAGYDGAKRRRGSKVHTAVDTLGHLLAATAQEVTGDAVEVAFVDQGYTGAQAAEDAQAQHMRLEVVKLPEAKRRFVLLPRRWVAERSNAWAARFRRLARDYERLAETLAGLHFVAFAILMLKRFVMLLLQNA